MAITRLLVLFLAIALVAQLAVTVTAKVCFRGPKCEILRKLGITKQPCCN
nr:venom peptide [Acharia stimulea]